MCARGREGKGRVLCVLGKGRVLEWKEKEKGGGSRWGRKEEEKGRGRELYEIGGKMVILCGCRDQ